MSIEIVYGRSVCSREMATSESESRHNRKKRKTGRYSSISSDTSVDYVRSTSQYERKNLEAIGVSFAEDRLPVNELFERLRVKTTNRKKKCNTNFLSQLKKFSDISNEVLSFSCSFNDLQQTSDAPLLSQKELTSEIENAIGILPDLYKGWKADLYMDKESDKILFKQLFKFFYAYVFKFLRILHDIVNLLIAEETVRQKTPSAVKRNEDSTSLTEGLYTELIVKFTELFFLDPVHGGNRKRKIMIRNKTLGCIPDVRFYQRVPFSMTAEMREELFMLIEVKQSALKSNASEDGTWIERKLKREVLDHIGTELLAECQHSIFCPDIVGIVCMRTEIIFMVLEIESSHYKAIMGNRKIDGKSAIINYSRSYDILNADDRKEIADSLLWLACVQKTNFHEFYLGE